MHHLHQSTHICHPLPQQKSKPTPSDIQSEHMSFTFHYIPSHPNYISKLKLPMHIAKLCSNIQHKAESSIIQIIEKHLSKQNKHKKSKKSKNNNKKPHNFKPRFQPIKHPPTSQPYTATKTDTTTTTQYNPPILKTTATKCIHPTLKTAGTQYILPTSQNHSSTHTKSQHPSPYQPNTHHTSQHTHRSTPSDNHHPFKRSSPSSSPSPSLTFQTTAHLPYHIPSQPTHKTLRNTTYHPSSTSDPKLLILPNNANPHLSTKTITIKPNDHHTKPSPNQNQTITIKSQHITTSTNNIATTSYPMPLLFHKQINPAMMELLLQRGNQSRHH